ncbi:hypothetical protein [Amycolatopsis sp. H20-H5]|uniref:hypothetical protein n=1 Tax=Amycolatopsis sp. H20-H5 TaxID=3046309 RepID=UPI002DB5B92D|nr:hypothetical protein [Amycolatopsis sp. H20-H5]MEC3976774.1 hypothetical protein [Amycolatopsis sp. H20-H5]
MSGAEFEIEHLVATPVQALRAAMRLYEMGLGLSGFTLCLMDFYTGARWGEVPPSVAVFYEELMDSHQHLFVMCTPEGRPWRRSNFRSRHWRPAWDGSEPGGEGSRVAVPAILPTFTFDEGRHSHATWLVEDGIPDVVRRARLGHKMKGMARVYDHVTPEMCGGAGVTLGFVGGRVDRSRTSDTGGVGSPTCARQPFSGGSRPRLGSSPLKQ